MKTSSCDIASHKGIRSDRLCLFRHPDEKVLCTICLGFKPCDQAKCREVGERRPVLDLAGAKFQELKSSGHIKFSPFPKSKASKATAAASPPVAVYVARPTISFLTPENLQKVASTPGRLVLMDNARAMTVDASVRINYAALRRVARQDGMARFQVFGHFPDEVQLKLKQDEVLFENILNPTGEKKEVALRIGAWLLYELASFRLKQSSRRNQGRQSFWKQPADGESMSLIPQESVRDGSYTCTVGLPMHSNQIPTYLHISPNCFQN